MYMSTFYVRNKYNEGEDPQGTSLTLGSGLKGLQQPTP